MFPQLYHQDVVIAKWDKWGLRYGGNAGLSKWTEGMLQRIIDEQPSARKWKWHQYDGMIAKLNKTKINDILLKLCQEWEPFTQFWFGF